MKRQLTAAATIMLAATAATLATTGTAAADTVAGVRVLGERSVDANTWLGGTRIGGLSGIERDASGQWYLISDDVSRWAPARFYNATLALDETGFSSVQFTGVTKLRQADGTPPTSPSHFTSVQGADPEAIRVDPADGTLLWASEGARRVRAGILVDPTVRRAGTDGTFVAAHPTATHLSVSTEEKGPRNDRALEGLTLNTGGTPPTSPPRFTISAMEAPLIQDGEDGPVRLTFANRTTGAVLSQLAYQPDEAHGVAEILAVDASRYLVLERATRPDGRHSVRLFEANTAGARSVLPLESLEGATYTPVTKRLVADFSDLDLSRVANLEGMAWGPTLPSGERTLVLVSDNECDDNTQFVALAVTLS